MMALEHINRVLVRNASQLFGIYVPGHNSALLDMSPFDAAVACSVVHLMLCCIRSI
jgi:hypothetical protein